MSDDAQMVTPPASAPASSPAPSAPAADVKPARPSSWSEALKQGSREDAASSAASEPASGDDSSAATTVLPTDAGQAQAPAKELPPVPHARLNEVIEQRKAAEKRAAEFEEQLKELSWAKGINQQQVRDLAAWRRQAFTDPNGFFQNLMRSAPPDVVERLRSEYGRQLATRNEPQPQPDLITEAGQRVYSAEQLQRWYDWRSRQQQADFAKQLEPLKRELEAGRTQRAQAHAVEQSKAFASAAVEHAHSWPYFSDHLQEIAEEYAKQPTGRGTPEEELIALGNAWRKVLAEKVLPSLKENGKAAAVAEFQTKAAASTEQPGRATTTTPKKPASMRESLERAAAAANWRP